MVNKTCRKPCLRKSSAQPVPPWRAKTQSDWVSRYNANGQENRWVEGGHLSERSSPRPCSCDRERQRGGVRSSLPLRATGSARELRFLAEGTGADQIRVDREIGRAHV